MTGQAKPWFLSSVFGEGLPPSRGAGSRDKPLLEGHLGNSSPSSPRQHGGERKHSHRTNEEMEAKQLITLPKHGSLRRKEPVLKVSVFTTQEFSSASPHRFSFKMLIVCVWVFSTNVCLCTMGR